MDAVNTVELQKLLKVWQLRKTVYVRSGLKELAASADKAITEINKVLNETKQPNTNSKGVTNGI